MRDSGNPDAAQDARLIVEHATGANRLDLVTGADRTVSAAQSQAALAMLARRLAGEPVHRILGFREFYGLRLELSEDTLEPRPDTEALVDLVLPQVRAVADRRGRCDILDLGTGTGAVALALLSQEGRAFATGADISPGALATAAANADINHVADHFTAVLSDWYSAVEGQFDVIVSNPPYIRSADIGTLSREVRIHDPLAALDGGVDGLHAYRVIAAGAQGYLAEDGCVAVEVGYDQAGDVNTIFAAHGLVMNASARDLGGHERALLFGRE